MSVFLWIVPERQLHNVAKVGGISTEYLLSADLIPLSPEILIGSKIWVVARINTMVDVLFSFISVETIEAGDSNQMVEEMTLKVDVKKSFRCSKTHTTSSVFAQPLTRRYPLGLSVIDDGVNARIVSFVQEQIPIKLSPLQEKLLNNLRPETVIFTPSKESAEEI